MIEQSAGFFSDFFYAEVCLDVPTYQPSPLDN
jgi:hypothetical protein